MIMRYLINIYVIYRTMTLINYKDNRYIQLEKLGYYGYYKSHRKTTKTKTNDKGVIYSLITVVIGPLQLY